MEKQPKHPFHWDYYLTFYDRFQALARDLADVAVRLETAKNLPEGQRRPVARAIKEAQSATEHAKHLLQQAWSLQADLEQADGE